MDSALTTQALPIGIGIIMFGLGMSLTVDDFRQVGKQPKAVAIALALQIFVLPVLCFALVVLFGLPPLLGIGMMILAASPGGTSANLFSHLFRGDLALNVTLTAINSIVALVTLPIIASSAISYFDQDKAVSLPLREVLKVFVIVLGPVVIGMFVRARNPAFTERMARPVRIGSAIFLAVIVLSILFKEYENVADNFAKVGVVAGLFCAASLTIGYFVPKALGVTEGQAIASSMEIGLHNATLAIYIAVEGLKIQEISIPAAVYALFMFVFAALWGAAISRRVRLAAAAA